MSTETLAVIITAACVASAIGFVLFRKKMNDDSGYSYDSGGSYDGGGCSSDW